MTGTIFCLGEAMGKISIPQNGAPQIGVGGDVYNTAVYLSHLGHRTEFVSAIGDDPFGASINAQVQHYGLGNRFLAVTNGPTGIYSIRTDALGERSFHYWREQAPAREMLSILNIDALIECIGANTLFLSGITLWVLRDSQAQLYQLLDSVNANGGRVVFDGNFRARLWQSDTAAAQKACLGALSRSQLALLTFEDEQLLWSDKTVRDCIDRTHAAGVQLVVLKRGAASCLISDGDKVLEVPVIETVQPVDTTAAGDSFNAGFLATWLRDPSELVSAARRGHQIAGHVIRHPGAILPDRQLSLLEMNE